MKKIIITMFAAAAISFSYLKYLVQKRKTQNVSF